MDFLEAIGWRWLRRAFPFLALLIMWAVLTNDTSRAWLMEKYQHRAERRIERVEKRLPSLFPTPRASVAP